MVYKVLSTLLQCNIEHNQLLLLLITLNRFLVPVEFFREKLVAKNSVEFLEFLVIRNVHSLISEVSLNEEYIAQLMDMGFPLDACKRAVHSTNNSGKNSCRTSNILQYEIKSLKKMTRMTLLLNPKLTTSKKRSPI